MFGGFGADTDGRVGDEVGLVLDLERVVETALEADRRGALRAHRLAAERAGDVPGEDLDAVRQLEQPPQRVEEVLGALLRADREIGPGRIADEERVAGQHEPRLVGPRAVDDGEAGVLGAVSGRVDRAQHDGAERDLGAVVERHRARTRRRRPGGSRSADRAPARAVHVRRGGRRACASRSSGRSGPRASPPPPGPARSRTAGRRSRRCPRPRRRPGTTHSRGRRRRTAGTARDVTLSGFSAGEPERGHRERDRQQDGCHDSDPREA